MKPKNIFLLVLLVTILLIILCILIHKKDDIFFKNFNTIVNTTPTPMPISKVMDKVKIVKKTLPELQKEINNILFKQPILFLDNSYSLDNNISNNSQTLDTIISFIKQIDKNIVIKIISYSDSNSSRSYNRELTQKRSDAISDYIKKRYVVKFIYAIGYGKEFSYSKDTNRTKGVGTEIYLKRIRNDF